MQIIYKNKPLERVLIGANALTAAVVVASFVMLFGFDEPLMRAWILYTVQVALLSVFIAEKVIRMFNAVSKSEFWRANWFEIPLVLGIAVFGVYGLDLSLTTVPGTVIFSRLWGKAR